MKAIPLTPESVNEPITALLFHGYRDPPSSKAKTRSTEAASIRNAPRTSTFFSVSFWSFSLIRSLNTILGLECAEGRQIAISMIDKTPRGALRKEWYSVQVSFTKKSTYLSRKTQRHVECVEMAPPMIGPRTLARAKTEEMIPMYLPYSSFGTRVGASTKVIE